MNNRFPELARKGFVALTLAVICGGFTACKDDYTLDDPGNSKPSWLGNSVYSELKNPNPDVLSGTFNYYLRLIDDLNYRDVLDRTGSMTVFASNDEAFERFFANNKWGVKSYEELSNNQKKVLLNSSILSNAMLVELLSNVSNGDVDVTRGVAMKHETQASLMDTITHIYGAANMPRNNKYWEKYYDTGIDLIMDATVPMLLHFTKEHLTSNSVTLLGKGSDFNIITGTEFNDSANTAYVYRDLITHPDVTCQNGYIQQVENVLLPPGNIAEMIRTNGKTNYFSRMLDYYSVPVYNGNFTNLYNDYAKLAGLPMKDSIFEKRYFSTYSQGSTYNASSNPNGGVMRDPNGKNAVVHLKFDPGWNTYYPSGSPSRYGDVSSIFVPTDEAMVNFFVHGGGAALFDRYADLPNTEANMAANLDTLFNRAPEIVGALIDLQMHSSFVATVPSKFGDVMNDASDPLGIEVSDIHKIVNEHGDSVYDVMIANNGVGYVLDKVFSPVKYVAVSAPALLNTNMKIMYRTINSGDKSDDYLSLDLNYFAYLLAMSANYGLFLPTDSAFGTRSGNQLIGDCYYVDPVYLGQSKYQSKVGPRVLHFYYQNRSPYVFCSQWRYDPETGVVGDSITSGLVNKSYFRTQLTDILNYHTVVLGENERIGERRFYQTKHGGEIRVDGTGLNMTVRSGCQIDGKVPAPKVTRIYDQTKNGNGNGVAYELDHVIQGPHESVYKVLSTSKFDKFMHLAKHELEGTYIIGEDDEVSVQDILNDIGISSTYNAKFKSTEQDAYSTFYSLADPNPEKSSMRDQTVGVGYDYNVRYFNSYNYTVYAPNNTAMEAAEAKGLPTWDDVAKYYIQVGLHDKIEAAGGAASLNAQEEKDPTKGWKTLDAETQAEIAHIENMVNEIDQFIRYHFQDNSVYVDKTVATANYSTAAANDLGIRYLVKVKGGNDQMTVTDQRGGTHTIKATGDKLVNRMAREFLFNLEGGTPSSILSSSFVAIHEVETPLNYHSDTDWFDAKWNSAHGGSAAKEMAQYKKFVQKRIQRRRLQRR